MQQVTLFDLPQITASKRRVKTALPFDVIFTWGGGDAACCIAAMSGWKYGVRSSDVKLDGTGICPRAIDRHAVVFVDNEFKDYDHEHHAAIVRSLKPAVASVRDLMTREQCAEAGAQFYEDAQIIEWSYELAAHVERVMLIPKSVEAMAHCERHGPPGFIWGYSVPTAYGGTPIPIEEFRGRKTHLLGGSWSAQLECIRALKVEWLAGFDNNHVELIAQYGDYVDPQGRRHTLKRRGLGHLPNPRSVALSMSFGAIMSKCRELAALRDI
jgi:hypothetical protein